MGNFTCCVVNCKNTSRTRTCKFHKFPQASHNVLQREKWIAAVNRKNADGSLWIPKPHHVICTDHFVNKVISNDPLSPCYAPRIFPTIYNKKKVNEQAALSRYNRLMNRRKANHTFNAEANCSSGNVVDEDSHISNPENRQPMDISGDEISTSDKECQVDFLSSCTEKTATFTCNRYIFPNYCDAEIQTEISDFTGLPTIKNRKKMHDKEMQCGASLADLVDKSIGFNANNFEENKKQRFFTGFPSIQTDDELKDIAGVTMSTFRFLILKLNNAPPGSPITKEQRLLIFLVKMKTGLTFSAIGIFFSLHRTTISKIFFSTLQYLSSSTANLVFWPSKSAVQQTMPQCFKPSYSNTRVIIDCTEFKIDVPSKLDDRVFCYSHYKKGFTAKVLIGITPSGFICFKSKVAGGRKSDTQITIESRLVDLLENGDVVLADKGFPEIRAVFDASGKQVLLIMPPFLEKNSEFTQEETELTYSIASVRIHVERIMQRLRIYNILNEIPEHLFSYVDRILHMACVLVNLQPPIFSDKSDDK